MKKSLIALTILSALSIPHITSNNAVQAQNRNVYRCVMKNDSPTTIVDTPRGRIDLIVWRNPTSGGWSPTRRCQEITRRFQNFSDRGALRYVTSGRLNNQPVICVAENRPGNGISCRNDGLLLTLEHDENPQRVMEQLFDISARVRGGNPITRSIGGGTILAMDRFLAQLPLAEEEENGEIIDITDQDLEPPSDPMEEEETNITPSDSEDHESNP